LGPALRIPETTSTTPRAEAPMSDPLPRAWGHC